jgi:hypothetical protein
MSYDPSHRLPPQERWLSATPAEGWPSDQDAAAYQGRDQAGYRSETDRLGAYPATTRTWSGYQHAAGGSDDLGYPSPVATDTFRPAGNDYGYRAEGYHSGGNGYAADDFDWRASEFGGMADGHAGEGYGYAGVGNGYGHAGNGYGRAEDRYGRAEDDYDWAQGSHRPGHEGYAGDPEGYAGDPEGCADDPEGYGWEPDGYRTIADRTAAGPNDLGPGSYTEYNEHLAGDLGYGQYMPGDPGLTAPDAGVRPGTWQAERDGRREARQRGLLAGAVTEVLGIAVAIGVSTLVAGLLKAQASPAAALGSVFIDRTPAALRSALAGHFGAHGQTVLLLGMYAAIALVALVVGVTARRSAALGVAGIAAFTLVAAFVTITRPAGHVADVAPAVAGGIAGGAAVLWLVRASAPLQGVQETAPLRHARGGAGRRAR